MNPTLCTRCKKNLAVVFITKLENGKSVSEGLCFKCARELKLPQVDEVMNRMGISDEDLDALGEEMSSLMGMAQDALGDSDNGDEDGDDIGSRTATFPHMSRLFGNFGGPPVPKNPDKEEKKDPPPPAEKGKKQKKRKFLDSFCMNLTQKARDNSLDKLIGREATCLDRKYPLLCQGLLHSQSLSYRPYELWGGCSQWRIVVALSMSLRACERVCRVWWQVLSCARRRARRHRRGESPIYV